MNEVIKSIQPPLDSNFFRRMGENDEDLSSIIPEDSLRKVLNKEIKMKEFTDKLMSSKQEKVTIREVVLESEIEVINSIKQLRTVYKDQLKEVTEKLNDLYVNELAKINELYRRNLVGQSLIDIVRKVSSAGWFLVMKQNSVNLCKFYSPMLEVTEGFSEKGYVQEYASPICYLKCIFLNILHSKIGYGSIQLSSDGQHPNVDHSGLGSCCTGSLEGRSIPLENPDLLLELLNEISSTYERFHIESTYYTPTIEFTKRKDDQIWKTA
ncbi:MAG: hypothetical protein NTY74_14040 [Ignavibacteriae bacterium]|nr:hypothetical protein [Ignavibacteriota bacterium]